MNDTVHTPYNLFQRIAILSAFFIVCIICLDISLQVLYRIISHTFTWNVISSYEVFRVPYLTGVQDERFVIPKKNSSWNAVSFDENGFRTGLHTKSPLHKNTVFIGDSVPFGFDATSSDTVPSMYSVAMNASGSAYTYVINAAVPSYSLRQSVYRYIYDIYPNYPVSDLILQVFDPADMFFRLKHTWGEEKNWYTELPNNEGAVVRISSSYAKYSSLFYLVWRYSGMYFQTWVKSSHYMESDIQRYSASIRKSLETLYAFSDHWDHLILLPIRRPNHVYETISQEELIPITLLNSELKSFAKTHPNVYFLDTEPLFASYNDEEIFLDTCCHLTKKGAQLQAEYIVNFIRNL